MLYENNNSKWHGGTAARRHGGTAARHCLYLYSVDSLRALICYCFVNYCLLY